MEENCETPQFDKIIVYHNGKKLEIETFTMDQILYYIDNIKFELKDFSNFKSEKQILEYYYNKEKESIGYMDINFQKEKDFQDFFKNFTKEIIIEKYKNNEQISKIKDKIESGIDIIIKQLSKNKNLELNNLENKYVEVFKTNKIPTFIEDKIIGEIQSIQLIRELNDDNNNRYLIKDINNEILLDYYKQFLNGEAEPFQIGDKKILFNILLYSNMKDIYKNIKFKNIFLENYFEITRVIKYPWENISEFENEIDHKKGFDHIKEKLIETFSKYEINDSHLYTLASFFYLTMNIIKDPDINNKNGICLINNNKNINININNPFLNKILKNILNCFPVYCPNEQYNFDIYRNLINYLNNYIITNGTGEKENKYYGFSTIIKKIKQTKNQKINNDFDILNKKINVEDDKQKLFPQLIISKISSIFKDEPKDSFINLIPLTKNRHTNTITILISGFLSENDDINSWKHFYNYDRNNSNYYLFRWPSSGIISFIFKAWWSIISGPRFFLGCKRKAKYAGKILALFLASNEEFNNCQINLAGFSLGSQVLKYCLKELNEIKGHRIMINNVVFLAGATVIKEDKKNIWRNIFKNNVGGRVINCFSTHDSVLGNLFRLSVWKNPIGLNKLNIKDENDYDIVEDYDFSDLRLGHTDYRDNFKKVLERINFLN